MNSCLKKFIRFSAVLMFAAAFLISCKNSFFQSYEPGDIELILPYGQSQEQSRAASGKSYNFEVTFVHTESKAQKVLTGKSGQSIVYSNAAPGNYEIHAQAFDDAGTWEFDGEANALVKKGKTTTVDLAMKRIIRIWAQNENMRSAIESFFDNHKDSGFIIDCKYFEDEEEYIKELKKVLSTKASNAPDIYFVDHYRTYDFVKGSYKDYSMPYANLGINVSEALDKAKILSYIQTLGSDYTDPNNPVLKALCYQSTIGFYLYNKQLANTYLESDDPEVVEKQLFKGGQSGNDSTWDYFREKAQEFAYSVDPDADYLRLTPNAASMEDIVIGNGESWANNSDPTKVYISQKREEILTAACMLDGFTKNHWTWGNEWYDDMTNGNVLGFFGPMWLLNYVLEGGDEKWGICRIPDSYYNGGYYTFVNNNLAAKKKSIVKDFVYWLTLDTSSDGFMYRMASRQGDGTTESVASLTVQEEVNRTVPFLRDDRMFDVYKQAAESFTISKNAGAYHYEMMNELHDVVFDLLNDEPSIAWLKLQVRIANSTGLDVDTESINNIPTSLTIQANGNNGITLTGTDNFSHFDFTEKVSGISTQFTLTSTNTSTMYYPFTQAGKWYLFDIYADGSYTYAIKAHGGMSCPVTWSDEYFGYNDDGYSDYISDPAVDKENHILTVTFSNEFSKYLNFSSNVTNKWIEINGYRFVNRDWQAFFHTGDEDKIEIPTNPDGSTTKDISEDNFLSTPVGSTYYLEIRVCFQIDGFSNVYFKIPSLQSTQYNYPLS